MANTFFVADTHFGHAKVLTFESSTRNFTTIEEHDEALIANWNAVVRPKDTVWHLGDVYLGNDYLRLYEIIHKRLNGIKKLVRGNHDTFSTQEYIGAGFDEVYGVWQKYGFVMSHVPLHPDSVDRWKLNVHGHLHSNIVEENGMNYDGVMVPDTRYYCVSVEQHGLAPVSLDKIRTENSKRLK